jgi:hypothetical protein
VAPLAHHRAHRQVYEQTVRLTNASAAPLEGEIRAGSADRYVVAPPRFRLRPGEAADVAVTLRLLRFGARQRAAEQGQRDWFAVKLANFPGRDLLFHATFFLDAAEAPADGCGCCFGAGPRGLARRARLFVVRWQRAARCCTNPPGGCGARGPGV